MRTFVAVTLCAALVLVAFGSAAGAGASQMTGPPRRETALLEGSAGCTRSFVSGSSTGSLQYAGLQRRYRLAVPKSYDPQRPMALVLNFHGYGGTGRQIEAYTDVVAASEANSFIAVSPDGAGSPPQWTLARNAAADDSGFVRALIEALSQQLCIDSQRIYAMGISNGGFFSSLLACDLNDVLAAIAPVAGEPFVALRCGGKQPVPVIAFHGTADTEVPFDGGIGTRFNIPLRSVRENMQGWARLNGCGPELITERVADDVVLESYGGCTNGADVQLYVIEEGGHNWPGGVAVRAQGYTTQSINATSLIWRFFEAHPRP